MEKSICFNYNHLNAMFQIFMIFLFFFFCIADISFLYFNIQMYVLPLEIENI